MGKGVFPKNYWLLAAILILCGVAVETALPQYLLYVSCETTE